MINFVKNIYNIQTEKLDLIEWIAKLNGASILRKLNKL